MEWETDLKRGIDGNDNVGMQSGVLWGGDGGLEKTYGHHSGPFRIQAVSIAVITLLVSLILKRM